ncbi:MAG: hypothetical protein V4731_07565 [Pseudomonadota bacterium]
MLDATAGTGGEYWNASAEWTTADSSFTDAIHLRWLAARQFSAAVTKHFELARQTLGASPDRATPEAAAKAPEPNQRQPQPVHAEPASPAATMQPS